MKKAMKILGSLVGVYFTLSLLASGGVSSLIWLAGAATITRYAYRLTKRVITRLGKSPIGLPRQAVASVVAVVRFTCRFAYRATRLAAAIARKHLILLHAWMRATAAPWTRRHVTAGVAAATMTFGPNTKTATPDERPVVMRFAA